MKVYSRFTPQMEFMASLYVFEQQAIYKKTDLGAKWRKQVAAELPEDFCRQLENKDVSATLTWLHRCIQNDLTAGESVEDLLGFVQQEEEEFSPEVCKGIVGRPPLPAHDVYPLLDAWNDCYFSKLDPAMIAGLRKKQADIQELIGKKTAKEVINIATNGLSLDNQPDDLVVTLIPQYHARPVILYHMEGDTYFYQYAADDIPEKNGALPPVMLRVQQALSDENRLRILKLLAAKPQTFKAIHQYSGLAKSTVHHHLITLRSAGLVHLHISPGKPEYYTFRAQGLKELDGRMMDYVYGGLN
ncbi:DNA-binding transcriptional regulator, ArsR family [Evansella caseinilytica]|uniref:DNA-binding transcriptional regulator, ArsR family n=1 Tax=Evansella caseinilytica TaxID=1503961 RepID=A0A1H3UPF0_9BACI|nr:winged helix-turn-helix domain-containing protein [Evansella caseinilytica]SDZ64293.1 DNA-binding transcriptional regulator, ArsR family [Evansella caseinilytica]